MVAFHSIPTHSVPQHSYLRLAIVTKAIAASAPIAATAITAEVGRMATTCSKDERGGVQSASFSVAAGASAADSSSELTASGRWLGSVTVVELSLACASRDSSAASGDERDVAMKEVGLFLEPRVTVNGE